MIDTLLAMSVIPMAIFGGVLGLLITGIPFSVSAAIGFIALFGIAVMDGIIILSAVQPVDRRGFRPHQGRHPHGRASIAAGADDVRGCRRGPVAGGAIGRNRVSSAKATRGRGRLPA